MGVYLLLSLAIGAEVAGTIALKLSDGFSHPLPSVVVVLGYGFAFVALAMVLKAGMPVGVAYAIWAAAGVALVALIGAMFLDESLTPYSVAGLGFVILGVVLLEIGQPAT